MNPFDRYTPTERKIAKGCGMLLGFMLMVAVILALIVAFAP